MDRLQVEELKDCLEEYLLQRGLPLRKAFRCLNPAHEDRHPSMSYHREGKQVRCFSCGVKYDVFDLIGMDYRTEDFKEQLRLAAGLFQPERPLLSWTSQEKVFPKGAAGKERPVLGTDRTEELEQLRREADSSVDYFLSRGIVAESVKKYQLFQREGRAYFPVLQRDKCTGWCARAVDDRALPRYKNSTGSLGLWNGDLLDRDGGGGILYVTEGVVDAILLEQMGRRAVALCGSQNVGKLIRRCGEGSSLARTWRFVACGDGDEAGQSMNRKLEEELGRLDLSCTSLSLEEGDVGDWYATRRQELEDKLREVEAPPRSDYGATSAAAALDALFAYRKEREREGVATGFPALDRVLDGGLYPGLYVLGAISSLGKTSFALQIADYLAENCCDVLYYSLEQSRFELMAKSLSRLSRVLAEPGGRGAFTARDLFSGFRELSPAQEGILAEARELYARGSRDLFLREGVGDISAAAIREGVRQHVEARGRAPTVFVDYLQILSPADPRSTDKQNTDRAVVELKRLSRDYNIPVVAISSFNRENYRAAASMESFKESGAVEYSADVLLGLQLKGAGKAAIDVNEAKLADPRKLELVLLKNRNGIPYARLDFDYHIRYSLFKGK